MSDSAKDTPINHIPVKDIPIKGTYWAEASDVSILSAACLSFGFEPSALDDYMAAMGEPASVEDGELPVGFSSRIAALKSAVRAKVISTTATTTDAQGRYPGEGTFIPMSEFFQWCITNGIEVIIPGLRKQEPAQSLWPWGTHDTKLLQELSAAASYWWVNYDPTDQTTAPTSARVQDWLVKRHVPKRIAEVMAKILRVDGLPPGPRR